MKVLFYDGWTKGIRCFKTIEEELRRLGHETILVHTGSYKEDVPKEEYIDGLLCRDIKYYKTRHIYKVLKKEKPDVLVSLNTKYIWDRANILACRKLGIKSVFLMHGDFPMGNYLEEAITAFKPKSKFKNKKGKAFLYLNKIIPNYLYSILKQKPVRLFNFKTYKIILSYLKDQYQAMMQPIHTADLHHDFCLVYSRKYIDYYINVVNYPKDRIKVVGKPDYDAFFNRIHKDDFSISKHLPSRVQDILKDNTKYALYMENGYPEVDVKGWSDSYRNEHLNAIAERLKKEGYKLVVKLHPHTNINKIVLKDDSVIVVQDADLYALVNFTSLCVVHASTTNEIPIVLNKPIIYPKWGASKNGVDYFKDSEAIEYWYDINDDLPLEFNPEKRQEYINLKN